MKKFILLILTFGILGGIQAQSFVSVQSKTISITNYPLPIEVVSNSSWTATSNQEWLKVSLSGAQYNSASPTTLTFNSASNTTTLLWFSAQTNTSAVKRSGTVKLSTTDGAFQIINVTQDFYQPQVNVSTKVLNLSNSSQAMFIESNTNWTATSKDSWLQVSLSGSYFGSTSSTVSFNSASGTSSVLWFSAQTNTTQTTRTGTVEISAPGIASQTITVNQVSESPSSPAILIESKAIKIKSSFYAVNVVSNTPWTATSNQAWLNVGLSGSYYYSSASPTVTFHSASPTTMGLWFSPQTNTTSLDRTAKVVISAPGLEPQTIEVTQEADLTNLIVNETAVNIKNNSHGVIVSANASWTAKPDQSWLKVGLSGHDFSSATSTVIHYRTQNSTEVLWFTAETNTSALSRTANIVISAEGAPIQKIVVTQEAGKAIEVSSEAVVFNEKTNKPITITITASVEWTAVSDQDWLNTSITEKRGSALLTITSTPNTTNAARTAKISIVSTNGTVLQVITVTQAAGAGTSVDENSHVNLHIWPNPVTSSFSIDTNAVIEVYSLLGSLQFRKTVESNEAIAVENLPSGVYIISIQTATGSYKHKITKE